MAPSFLLACVLWADVRKGWNERLQPKGNQRLPAPVAALLDAVDEVFENRIGDVSGRGKLGADMREIWVMQPRFERRTGNGPFSLIDQPRFRAGFDFLRLRAQVGEIEEELAHWWETFQNVSDDMRQDMVDAQRKEGPGKARRVKRTDADHPVQQGAQPAADNSTAPDPRFRRDGEGGSPGDADHNRAASDSTEGADHGAGSGEASDAAAPKKRRRRRRKPTGEGSSPSADAGDTGE